MRSRLRMATFGVLAFAACACPAQADGGLVRLSERVGGCQVTVFTSPTPVRSGPVDVSVLVQDAAGSPVPDARVVVHAAPTARPEAKASHPATAEAATNKLFRAAQLDLPGAGEWLVEVEVDAGGDRHRAAFRMDAAEPLPRWREVWPWVAWPMLPVLLFGVHQVLVRRSAGASGKRR